MKPKHLLLAGLALMAAAVAQTRMTADQLRAGAVAPLRLLAIDSAGRFAYVAVGAGLEIAGTTLQATTAGPKAPAKLARNADGTYVYPGGAVFRNGLLQTPGADYTVSGSTLTPTPTGWAADDVVTGY